MDNKNNNNIEESAYRKASNNFSVGSNTVFNQFRNNFTIDESQPTSTTSVHQDHLPLIDDDEDTADFSNINDTTSEGSSGGGGQPGGGEQPNAYQTFVQSKPKTFVDGAFKGLLSIGGGVVAGVKGIVAEPIKGARKEGVTGFAKGVAKGVSGAVVLPVVGVVEFFSMTTQGIINTPLTVIDAMKNAPKEEDMISVAVESKPIFFGVEIEKSFITTNELKIPHIVRICIDYLLKKPEIEGIFRVNGSKVLIDDIQKRFDKGEIHSVEELNPHWTYEISCIFKSYFRYLPNSIIPEKQISELLAIQSTVKEQKDKVTAFKKIVSTIQEPYYSILYECIELLYNLSLHSKVNLMSPSNLSVCFGASLLRPEMTSPQEIANSNTIVFLLIGSFKEIFTKPHDPKILGYLE
eukprot:gene3835-4778_t